MDDSVFEQPLTRIAAVMEKMDESCDKLTEFNGEQVKLGGRQATLNERQAKGNEARVAINHRLERLLAEVIRQRRNGNPNGGAQE